jgi:hypothetical protein
MVHSQRQQARGDGALTKAAGKGRWCTHKGSRSKTQTVKQTVKQIVNVFGVAVLLHLTMKTGTALSAK